MTRNRFRPLPSRAALMPGIAATFAFGNTALPVANIGVNARVLLPAAWRTGDTRVFPRRFLSLRDLER